MADDKFPNAIDAVAKHVVEFCTHSALGDLWECYPEIGENDWHRICDRAEQIVDLLAPDKETFDAAYDYLKDRADDDA